MHDQHLSPPRKRRLGALRLPSSARRALSMLTLVLAFVLPPLLVGGAGAALGFTGQQAVPPPSLTAPLPERPAYDPSKPNAVIVVGNAATESSDLMGPYETLATSGHFNVYVAAPERMLSPLFPSDLAIVPHYSFAEYDATFGGAVDLLVVPYIPFADSTDAAVVGWIREKSDRGTTVLSICAGALAVADSGVLAGRPATTHHFSMQTAERTHPEIQWVHGVRYVDAGQFISSQGVTAGVDAALYTLGRMFGREAAMQTAQAMGYPHTRFLDDPTSPVGLSGDTAVWPNFYRWGRTDIGLVLYDGVGEIDVSSVIDTYPRSLGAAVRTLAAERGVIQTRHGLALVPYSDFATAPALDRLLVPGAGPAPASVEAMQGWAAQHGGLTVERIHATGGYPYDATFRDLARGQSNAVARSVANTLEYPTRDLSLDGPSVALDLMLRPLALGLLGLGVAAWLRRRSARSDAARPGSDQAGRLGAAARASGRFVLHFAEMSLAMVAGVIVFHLRVGMHSYESATESSPLAFAAAYEIGMMVFMTVPMVGWMRVRGHSWRHGAEMAVGMLAPVIAVDLLLAAGIGTAWPWLQQASGPAMLLGMAWAMLLRREHYAGAHVHPSPAAQPIAEPV
jgi:putative intracellular protease/amidase